MYRSRIGGSVQVKQGGAATVRRARITGDIQYDANRRYLRANRNKVGGSIQVIGNSGGAEIYRNVIDGNLQCKENSPAPTGGGNVVGGNKENQCRRFYAAAQARGAGANFRRAAHPTRQPAERHGPPRHARARSARVTVVVGDGSARHAGLAD